MGETHVGTMGPRSFVGELGLLNGQGAFLSARATKAGRMLRVSRSRLRVLMAEDDELCDIILHALWARREILRTGPAALTLKLVGPRSSREFLALRRFAERVDLVHTAIELAPGDLVVLNDTRVLPARLPGRKASGGACELLLERVLDGRRILAQARASKGLKPGTRIELPGGARAVALERPMPGIRH